MRPRVITPLFTSRAKAMRARGLNLEIIAERLGACRQTVSNAIGPVGKSGNGGKRRHHCPRVLTPLQEQEVVALVKQGLLIKQIAYQFGVHRDTVGRTLRRVI